MDRASGNFDAAQVLAVLLLEDSDEDALLVERALRKTGFAFSIRRARGESEFLAQLDSGLDLILADYHLPGYSGLKALDSVRIRDLDVPFIVVSGAMSEEQGVEAIRRGADDYLLKDRLGRLGSAIAATLEQRALRGEAQGVRQALAQTEYEFREAFDHAPIGMALTTLEGRWLRANRALCELVGYTEKELQQSDYRSVTHVDDVAEDARLLERLVSGKISSTQREKRYLRKDGRPVSVKVTASLVRDSNGQPLYRVLQVMDVTSRKQAEERFEWTFEQAAVGIAHVSLDNRIMKVNRRYCDIVGYAAEELVGRTPAVLTHPEDAGIAGDRRDRLLSGDIEQYSQDKRYIRKDGALIWVRRTESVALDDAGAPMYFIRVIEDVTERKRTEDMLERANRVRRVLVECSRALVHARNEQQLFDEMCRIVVESGGYRQSWIGLPTEDSARPLCPIAYAGYGHDAPMAGASNWTDDGRYQGLAGEAVHQAEIRIARNILKDPRQARKQERALALGYQSSIALPLKGDGQILGVLMLHAREEDAFDEDEIELLSGLANDIAFGITNLRTTLAHQKTGLALRESERRARETFEQAAVGITRVDLNGILVGVNQKFCDMLGYQGSELIGMAVRDITPPEDYGQGSQFRAEMSRGAMKSMTSEKRFMRKDGTLMWARRTMSPACDEAGNPQYIISVVEDITERRAAEERYRTTVDYAPVGIMHTDMHEQITDVNRKMCELLGYSEQEMLQMKSTDLVSAEQRGAHRSKFMDLAGGKYSSFISELPMLRKDRSTMWVRRVTSLMRDSSGKPWYFVRLMEDITDRKQAAAALKQSEEQFTQLASNIPQVFWIADVASGRTVYVSAACEQLLGIPAENILRNPRKLITAVHGEDRLRVYRARKLAALGKYNETYRILRPDGAIRWVQDRAFPVHDAEGNVYRVAGIAEDVTERKLAEERLMHLAHYDVLTSLPNRVLFYDRLRQALAQGKRNKWTVGVMFIDVDRFKNVNDTLGHAVGDKLLQLVSERLTRAIRAGDTVGRLGGDEFAVVLGKLAVPGDATVVAQKIMASFNEPFQLEGAEMFISASIGITLYPDDSLDQDTLISNADAAMYRAKDMGRNTYQFYTPEMNARAREMLDMENSLRRALERDEFLLHYQPKVDVASGAITGVEALLRWRHPERGIISPVEFIPILEETGLIVQAGSWVLHTVCKQLKQWQREGVTAVPVAVNLSARQFLAHDLGPEIKGVIEQHQIDPALLQLEITESSIMANTEEAIRTLEYLESLGVGLSIDDFGTGYSSLGYLKRFPLDALKIDKSFVADVTSDADDATITRAVISMAHSLGLLVVAEGVETEAQLSFLAAHGCDQIQGFLFGKPLPADECGRWLAEGRRLVRDGSGSAADAPVVMLVDDDDDALLLLKRALSRDRYRIVMARSAGEALAMFDQLPVSVVITDQNMPGMSGVEFLQRLKRLHPATRRLMTSAHSDFQSVADAVNKGEIFRFLPKSLSDDELRAEVRCALKAGHSGEVPAGVSAS
jgi:diguanylate cyclase (GGDEF)-like protein/PAS domain S-box-containing protein